MADITTGMKVTGISQYKSAMSQAQASVKQLDSALKRNEAQFKATGDKEQYMADKARLLNSRMQSQKAYAQQAEAALKTMESQGVSKVSKAYQEMLTKLNQAQEGMLNTKVELDNLTSAEETAATGADKLTSSVNGISKKVSLDAVITGINSITSAMEKAAGKAVQLGEAIWSNIMSAAQWADDSATMALMYGVDLDTFLRVQKLVQNGMDTSVESILKSQQKLTKNVGNGSDSFMQTLVDLGLAVQTYGKNGEVSTEITSNATDLFWEAGAALMALDDEFEKESKAQELFGKSWRELIPLFTQFANQDEYNKALEEVYVNSEEDVTALAELNDKVGELKGNFETLSNEVWAQMAPALTSAADALNKLLTSVMDYLKTPEGKQALQDMETAVSGLFSDLGSIDPEQVVEGFTKVFNEVVSKLQWLVNNKDGVVNALKAIVAGWAGLKLTGGALQILQLINGVKSLTGGSGDTAAAAGGAAASAGGTHATLNVVKKVAAHAGSYLSSADPTGSAALILPFLEDNTEFGRQLRNGGTLQEAAQAQISNITDFVSSIPERLTSWYHESYWDEIVGGIGDWFGSLGPAWDDYFQLKGENERAYSNTLQDALTEMQTFFEGNPVEAETKPVVEEDAAADIAAQVGTVEIPAVLMVTSDKSGPYTKLGTFGTGSPLVYYSKDLNEHANGIWSVPYDGYPAVLHKGERVVPTSASSSQSYNSNLYVEKMIMNNSTDANGLANAMAAAQRRRMSGYGS